ncbi:FHA domain-containing protein [Persicirhabdus sediminis]|uniref:FHA domain-containing protein n=1 Tax=Persicirhabdus sediminis TaxID=454144 RepID=A0A8J7MD50_9BACT|nr:FHA domain-containing protein [Persicirhabdus sediminis]MBK1791192.1 FHA domain-containing protein [Persicirhabdus sediminis]
MPRVTISEPGKAKQPYRFKLDREIVKIGRGADCDIVIDCPSVSTHHCTMKRVPGGFVMDDENSTNGIKLNSTKLEHMDLYDGMQLLIGDIPLDFELDETELDALAEEEKNAPAPQKISDLDETKDNKLPPMAAEESTVEETPAEDALDIEAPVLKQNKRKKKKQAPATSREVVDAVDEEYKEQAAQAPARQRTHSQPSQAAAIIRGLLIFAAMCVAVFIGMSLRYYKETNGKSLPKEIEKHYSKKPADNAEPAEAAE